GIVTFLVAHLLAERLPRRLSYAEFFGRDRFFALVLISVMVRLLFDGFLLPELGDYLTARGYEYDYRNNLHSFGLIIVALIANQMWNGGLRFGLTAMALYVGLTYVIVRYVLMEFTNFNVSTLNYMYEDLASSILASPKAYIIVLISAFIASRMNLRYGWEFNGILIPSLLALQWYQPEKLLITLFESLVIYALAAALLRTRFFKQMQIEGPRLILLFFNIGFFYKMALGYFLVVFMPSQKVSDFYAFGYLLSTLLALKMYQKDIAVRVARATLQTSLAGVLLASLIGFMLTLMPSGPERILADAGGEPVRIARVEEDLGKHFNQLRASLYSSQQNTLSGQASPVELDRLNQLFAGLRGFLRSREQDELDRLAGLAATLELDMALLNGRHLVIRDADPLRGWGAFLVDLEADSELIVEVPAPLDEPQAGDAAFNVYRAMSARGLALAGRKRRQSADGSSDALQNPQTAFQLFHRHFGARNGLQVRQYTRQSARKLLGVQVDSTLQLSNLASNQLWIKKSIPPGLNVNLLDRMLGDMEIHWRAAPLDNRQQETSPTGFAELYLSPPGIRQVLAYVPYGPGFARQAYTQRIDGYLLNWISDNSELIAPRGSEAYVPAGMYELLFLDQNVITPIMRLLQGELALGWKEEAFQDVQRINNLGLALGYEIVLYHHEPSSEYFFILQEADLDKLRHWGTYVFRIGPAEPYVVQVPRPLAERNTLQFGASLFEQLDARALYIAGTHPYANFDGTANLLHNTNKTSMFNLVHQTVLREAGDQAHLVLQLRAFSHDTDSEEAGADVLLAKLGVDSADYPALTGPLETVLLDYDLSFDYVRGSLDTRGYDVAWNAQARYSAFTRNKPFYVLWVSPAARENYGDQEDNRQQEVKFATLGIQTDEVDVALWASQTGAGELATPRLQLAALREYFATRNVVQLHRFARAHPQLQLGRLIDSNTGQAYLSVQDGSGTLVALV
ncbi:MAG: poly-gamma-glutamate biosynthesis protein PgsC/CapC, partial [Halioglobus sp.]|nr:poly-gamma-glutamate biosynthesis protein PgsC/CapC [Halioglobus sp.]